MNEEREKPLMSAQPSKAADTTQTDKTRVACNGGGGALGHPNVYLEMDAKAGEVTCPYCSHVFVLKTS